MAIGPNVVVVVVVVVVVAAGDDNDVDDDGENYQDDTSVIKVRFVPVVLGPLNLPKFA